MNFALKTRNLALQMMNFAGATTISSYGSACIYCGAYTCAVVLAAAVKAGTSIIYYLALIDY